MKTKLARILAFYLPQFHPIKENDIWWGKGFTEWTNVGKAKKYFRNHYQPRVPADLGYYDLRVPEIRWEQAKLAKKYGIDGFLYWHYWFGNNRKLLERPFNEALQDKSFDINFALAWANESWQGYSHGVDKTTILMTQSYLSDKDHIEHFNSLLPAFKDKRYIKINGKPLFLIYRPTSFPNVDTFIKLWNSLAIENGFSGIYFIAHHMTKKDFNEESYSQTITRMREYGFDAINFMRLKGFIENRNKIVKMYFNLVRIFHRGRLIYSYSKASPFFSDIVDSYPDVIPTIISGWDNTPRHPNGIVLKGYTPKTFNKHVKKVFALIKNKPFKKRIIILKSWNEWAEGNYIEPDLKWGHSFLKVIRDNVFQ